MRILKTIAGMILMLKFSTGCKTTSSLNELRATNKDEVQCKTIGSYQAAPRKKLPATAKSAEFLLLGRMAWNYFEGIDIAPFEINCSTFSVANAWQLSTLSALSYLEQDKTVLTLNGEDDQAPQFIKKKLGLDEIYYFDAERGAGGHKNVDVNFWVLEDRDKMIFVFRGTEPASGFDWMTDGDYGLSSLDKKLFPEEKSSVKVHQGFQKSIEQALNHATRKYPESSQFNTFGELLKAKLSQTNKKVYVTGHSLGGALSTLFSYYLKKNAENGVFDSSLAIQTYTIGAPMVGDQGFSDDYNSLLNKSGSQSSPLFKNFRIVFNSDLVTFLIGEQVDQLNYRHVGQVVHVSADPNKLANNNQISFPDQSNLWVKQQEQLKRWYMTPYVNYVPWNVILSSLSNGQNPPEETSTSDSQQQGPLGWVWGYVKKAMWNSVPEGVRSKVDETFQYFQAWGDFLKIFSHVGKYHKDRLEGQDKDFSFGAYLLKGGLDHDPIRYYVTLWNAGIADNEVTEEKSSESGSQKYP